MARRPSPPPSSSARRETEPTSGPSRRERLAGAARSVDVREWASGIRLSGFAAIMLSLVVLGTWVLVPTIGTYVDQKQKIAALEQSVQLTRDEIADLERDRERWSDPAFITTQARERLYYVKPGEVVYLVDNDLDPADLPPEQQQVSDEIQERPADWMPQLLRSLTSAGLAKSVSEGTNR